MYYEVALILSLILIIILFTLGMTTIIGSKDHFVKKMFGYLLAAFSVFIFSLSISYYPTILTSEVTSLLLPGDFLLMFLFIIITLSIFPIISLNPEWRNVKVLGIILIPSLIFIAFYVLYSQNLIFTTELINQHSISGNIRTIIGNIHHPDVAIRVFLLFLIPLHPLHLFLRRKQLFYNKRRKPTSNYNTYSIFLVILSLVFVSFLIKLPYSLYLVLLSSTIILLIVGIGYRMNTSYLTVFSKNDADINDSSREIYRKVVLRVIDGDGYLDDSLQLQTIANEMGIRKQDIIDAIHSEGYSGFKEFINSIKLGRFKRLAEENHNEQIIVLSELAGFTSKTTFYRIFKDAEGITPTEFMDKLKNKQS